MSIYVSVWHTLVDPIDGGAPRTSFQVSRCARRCWEGVEVCLVKKERWEEGRLLCPKSSMSPEVDSWGLLCWVSGTDMSTFPSSWNGRMWRYMKSHMEGSTFLCRVLATPASHLVSYNIVLSTHIPRHPHRRGAWCTIESLHLMSLATKQQHLLYSGFIHKNVWQENSKS